MRKPSGPLHWVERERTPAALGLAVVLAYALGVLLLVVLIL